MEWLLLALLGLFPFALYRWFKSEPQEHIPRRDVDEEETHWYRYEEDDDDIYYAEESTFGSADEDYYTLPSDDDLSSTGLSSDEDYYISSQDDFSGDDTDIWTDPSYCFLEGNIWHDSCAWDDDISSSWDDWDDDWMSSSSWDDDW